MRQDKKTNPALTPRAQELRKNMTKQEKHLWYDFLCSYPVRIMRQRVIGRFIADFYCAKAKLVIEIDGNQHFTEEGKQYDYERELVMQSFGIETIRYTNNEVEKEFEAVCNAVDMRIKARITSPCLCGGIPLKTRGTKE